MRIILTVLIGFAIAGAYAASSPRHAVAPPAAPALTVRPAVDLSGPTGVPGLYFDQKGRLYYLQPRDFWGGWVPVSPV